MTLPIEKGNGSNGSNWHVTVTAKYDNLPKIGILWREEALKISKQTAEDIRTSAMANIVANDQIGKQGNYTDKDGSHPGLLLNSIIVQKRPGSGIRLQYQTVVTARYAQAQESGWHTSSGGWVPGRPFFAPAVQVNAPIFQKKMIEMLVAIPRLTSNAPRL